MWDQPAAAPKTFAPPRPRGVPALRKQAGRRSGLSDHLITRLLTHSRTYLLTHLRGRALPRLGLGRRCGAGRLLRRVQVGGARGRQSVCGDPYARTTAQGGAGGRAGGRGAPPQHTARLGAVQLAGPNPLSRLDLARARGARFRRAPAPMLQQAAGTR